MIVVLCVLSPLRLAAQEFGSIDGFVKNGENGLPLRGANVVLGSTSVGTATLENGSFQLNRLAPASYTLSTSYIGFGSKKTTVVVHPGEIIHLEILLRPIILPGNEVVVVATTARERETPATFSNLTKEQISERYSVQDIPVLLSDLPSITFYSENGNGIGYNYLNLRGFDQRRIAVMVNGIPQNDPEDHNVYWLDFPDLLASSENIQVQRGAGSAFYGPPAIGGSVNLIASPFHATPGIILESMFGFQEYEGISPALQLATTKHAVTVNSGLVNERYMLYGRLGKIRSDGYRENSWVEFDSYFLGGARFDSAMTTRIHIFGGPISDGLAYKGLPKFVNGDKTLRRQNLVDWGTDATGQGYAYSTPRRSQEIENFSQPHFEILHDWCLNSSVTLYNTIFYYTGEGFFDYDASWADTSMLRIGSQYGIPTSENPSNTLVRAFVGNKQWGWLPRVEVEHVSGRLTLGAELRFHRSIHWGKIEYAENLPPHFDPNYHFYEYNGEKDILSFYIHELFHMNKKMTLMTNFQFVKNRYSLKNEKYLNNAFTIPYFFVNPRIGVNYNVDENVNTYFSFAYTTREPRLRNLYAAEDSYFGATPQFRADTTGGTVRYDFNDPLAKPEQLLDIEIGIGYRDSTWRLSGNLYWMEFTNELVKSGQVDIFGQPVTGNAERSRHLGIEVEGLWNIFEAFSFGGNFSLSRNRLLHSTVIDNGASVALDGNPIAGFPSALGNVRITYHTPSLTTSLLAKYVGAFYTDNFQNEQNKNNAYTVLNGEALYSLPDMFGTTLTVRGEVRNIFNKLYFMSGEGNSFFPAAERNYLVGITMKL